MSNITGVQAEQAIARTFTARIYRGEEWYVAECLELGTVSQGKTIEAAVQNLVEATETYLDEFPAALNQQAELTPSLEEGVRELEREYAKLNGEAVTPSTFYPIETTTFTLPSSYA